MKSRKFSRMLLALSASALMAACAHHERLAEPARIGELQISTVPLPADLTLESATYTPSGHVLVSYGDGTGDDPRDLKLAVMNDDGTDFRPFFAATIPARPKDNGLRFMVFADNRRIFLGDFILECAPDIDHCAQSKLLDVQYPAAIADGPLVSHRWSEMIVAPDNRHVAWTTLLADYSALVFTGALERSEAGYRIVDAAIVSTVDRFKPDPDHADGVIPLPVRNGEVKQFVHGGTAISLAGARDRDTTDSTVLDLRSGAITQITQTPGYDETTIFSPDERLGIVMTTRFSPSTDLAILGLLPRPHPVSLNMGLSMFMYMHGVTGVRNARSGNIGPALIDIEASRTQPDYRGLDLHADAQWVYRSPMSWHPDGTKAMWIESLRGDEHRQRIRVVHLADYRAGTPVAAQATPDDLAYAVTDLSGIADDMRRGHDIDVKVYGRHAGYLRYRKNASGVVEKTYVDYSDDGQNVYSGSERLQADPRGNSTYAASIRLSGPRPGAMDLRMTFGPLGGAAPARLIFAPDASGVPLTHGYAEYDGQRLTVGGLVP
jgi:hypothetical protein